MNLVGNAWSQFPRRIFSVTGPLYWISPVKITLFVDLIDFTWILFSVLLEDEPFAPVPHPPPSNECQGNCLCFVTKTVVELEAPVRARPSWVLATKSHTASLCWFCPLSPGPLWTIYKIRKLRKQRLKKTWEMLSKENPFIEMRLQQQICQGNLNCRLSHGVLQTMGIFFSLSLSFSSTSLSLPLKNTVDVKWILIYFP